MYHAGWQRAKLQENHSSQYGRDHVSARRSEIREQVWFFGDYQCHHSKEQNLYQRESGSFGAAKREDG
jgi:hypothetical protein